MNRSALALLLVACLVGTAAAAQQQTRGRLPLESVTTSQGLPSDSITTITTDSRGYVWFGTLDGLSRYDGERFVSYTTDDGLPDRMIWSIAEDSRGGMWIGTFNGAAEMTPAATRVHSVFTRIPPLRGNGDNAAAVFVDRNGTVWSQCDHDLCVVKDGHLELDASFRRAGGRDVNHLASDAAGGLWLATDYGLMHREHGVWQHFDVQPNHGGDETDAVVCDRDGRVWITNGFGIIVYAPKEGDTDARSLAERAGQPLTPGMPLHLPAPGHAIAITVPEPSPIVHARTPYPGRDGVMWIPCYYGLIRIANGRIDFFDTNDGLPPLEITAVCEDPAGDIWIGTRGAGALRLARSGALTYNRAHGMANERIMSLFRLADDTVCSTNRVGISCFGTHGEIRHTSLGHLPGWGWNQIVAQDRDGSLWFASTDGLLRLPPVHRVEDLLQSHPTAVYTSADGLDGDDIFRVWEDSRGEVWVSTLGKRPLSRFDRQSRRFVSFGPREGLHAAPTAFAEDRSGNIWLGLYSGGLMRVSGGTFERIDADLRDGQVRDLKIDSSGRLWIAATGGVARIDDPSRPARQLSVTHYSRRDGLSSDSGYCLAEMPGGRMAIGSQRGLDILNLANGTVAHVTMREGLASNEVSVAMVSPGGALWLGTINGLSRLDAIPPPRSSPAPHPHIEAVEIDGVAMPVPELGTPLVSNVRIEYPHHTLAVRFSSPHYDPARPLDFQYRLGALSTWTDAGALRSVVFDDLPSGDGVFETRAVSAGGRASQSARVSYLVIPPFWKQTWFVTAALIAALALALLAHRSRVAHLVALERVRTRLATDLHDDLGSSLSRISILSEVAKGKLGNADPAPVLDEIAGSARSLVDALGDSIWSMDPRRDDVQSVLLRARNFAAAVFESQSISMDLRVSPEVGALAFRPEQRRETYLILKEALNNAAKHAGAHHVSIEATAEDRWVRIAVRDDGKGFVAGHGSRDDGGRGVANMIDRARRAGGTLKIEAQPGGGTCVIVTVPLQQHDHAMQRDLHA
jgi:ligand-binding sensor domain-containing protein/signal transduction histidine kinase